MIRKAILSKYEIKQLPNDGRYYVNLPGGLQPKKTRKEDLIQYLIDYETGKTATLVNLYPQYARNRRHEALDTTIYKEGYYFQRYLKDSKLGNKAIQEITRKDCHDFLDYCLEVKPDMQYKYWKNIKSFVSLMFDWASDNDITERNPMRRLRVKEDVFVSKKETPEKDLTYNHDEKIQILDLARDEFLKTNNPVSLGIVILFHLGLRVGELCGLRWGDIHNNTLHIQRQITKGELRNHPKTKSGNRTLMLPKLTLETFTQIKEANEKLGYPTGDDDYIFLRKVNGEAAIVTDRCFNGRLTKYCKKLGIPSKSCHDIRRTAITDLYESGMNTKQIQAYAGHSSQRMTEHYIKYRVDDNTLDYLNHLAL